MVNAKQRNLLLYSVLLQMYTGWIYKSVCAKQLAAVIECSISYQDKSDNAKRLSAAKRQKQRLASSIPRDATASHGPPDRACHFTALEKRYT